MTSPRTRGASPIHDAIVCGAGGAGCAALYHLARRGLKALAIDRFPPGHDRGSSHGRTRIIRLAYKEHPDYVPLLRRAYELWDELEKRRGETLLVRTGLLQAGPASGDVVAGVLRSAEEHGLDVEEMSAADAERRFPGVRLPREMRVVFESCAGALRVEACVRAHAEEALRLGAEIRSGEAVTAWGRDGEGFFVTTDRGRYSAARLVLTPGPWAGGLLADLGLHFEVLRKPVFWFRAAAAPYGVENGFPAFLFETTDGLFYGLPRFDAGGLKAAEHTGGDAVTSPLELRRDVAVAEEARVTTFLSAHLPGVGREILGRSVCMYTMTPDEHFVVDRHPEHANVVFAAGLSGHGFKFTSVLGEILAELAVDGRTRASISFLSASRPGLGRAG